MRLKISSVWTVLTSFFLGKLASGLVAQTDEPMTCLEAQIRCHGDIQCRSLLDNVQNVCDEDVAECKSTRYQLCYNILSSLQKTFHFRDCICDNIDLDATKCMQLRKTIYYHACLYRAAASNASYSVPQQLPSFMRTRSDIPVTIGELDPPIERKESCIAIRKQCMLNTVCNQTLEDFRLFCRESKKQGTCVTSQRAECFDAIQGLQSSGLFSCQCEQLEKEEPRTKCERIQYRLANNTCRVEVPYFIYSTKQFESDGLHGDLIDMVNDSGDPETGNDVIIATVPNDFPSSTCVSAFMACHSDSPCRLRMAEFLNACSWLKQSNACDKQRCLRSIRSFFLFVRPNRTHALLFCRCQAGDARCRSVQRSIYPACSVVNSPAPSCLHIRNQCQQDRDCSIRLQAYVTHCHYDKEKDGCLSGPAMCRSAQVETMGTVLTTNCTCPMTEQEELRDCLQARDNIQIRNKCTETAFNDFHKENTPFAELQFWNGDVQFDERNDCQSHLREDIPLFLNVPSVIRRYHNDSNCSDVCQCLVNGTLVCTPLPCKASLLCEYGGDTYDHGHMFKLKGASTRGECRCFKSEIVCPKAAGAEESEAGLFLNIGYSLSDQYLVEAHSTMKFQPELVSRKLGALMNGDSAEQFCSFTLHSHKEGNLVFQIRVSKFSPVVSSQAKCTLLARNLSYRINIRDRVIFTDAELSILKAAELSNITIKEPERTPSPLEVGLSVGSRTGSASTNIVSLLQLLIWTICGICLIHFNR